MPQTFNKSPNLSGGPSFHPGSNLYSFRLLVLLLSIFVNLSQGSIYLQVSIQDGQKQINSNGTYIFTLLPSSQTSFTSGTTFKTYYPSSITLQPKASGSLNMCSQYVSQTSVYTNFTCTYDTSLSMIQFTLTSSISFSPVFVYELGYFKNPSVAATVTGFRVVILDSSNNVLYNTSESTSAATTLPNSIINQSVTVLSNQTGVTTTYSFTFGIQDSIPAGGKIVITFPTTYISVPSSIANSNTLITIYSGSASYGSITTTTSTVTFDSAFPSGLTAVTTSYITISINNVVNPYSLQPTGSFSIATVDSSGNQINYISSGLTVTLTVASQISVLAVGPYTYPQVGQITDIVFNIILPYQYASGGYIKVIFPTEISIVSTLSCLPIIGFKSTTSSCSYISSTVPQSVKITGEISNTQVYFLISNVQNPLSTKPTSSFQLYAYDPQGYLTGQVTDGGNYSVSAGSLTSATATRNDANVGVLTGNYATITFTTQNILSSGQYITFKIPFEQFLVSTTSFKVYYNSVAQTYTLDSTSNSSYFIVNVSVPCTTTCAASTSLTYSFYGVQNPLSITNPSVNSIEIYTITSDKVYYIDQIISGVYATPSLIPGTLTDVYLYKDTQFVGKEAQYQFSITLANLIPADGLIRVYFPTYAVYSPSSGVPFCINIDDSNTYLLYNTVSYSDSLQGLYYIEVENKCEDGCAAGDNLNIRFTNLKNPGSVKPITNSFYIATYTSALQLIDAINITDAEGLDLVAAPFSSLTLTSPVSPIVTGTYSTYKFNITSINGIVYTTGLLRVTFPSKCVISNTSTCKATASGYTLSCIVEQSDNRVKIANNQEDETFADVNIILQVTNVENPSSTQETTYFVFQSMINDSISGTYYDVDYDDDTISITPDTPNSLSSVSVVRSATEINTGSEFTIVFTTFNPIPVGSSIYLYLPIDQLVIPSTSDLSFVDNILDQSVSLRTESSNSTYSILELKEWCSLGEDCPSNTELSLTISGTENPGSTSAPSNSFQIVIQVSSGVITDQILSGVYATPLLSSGPFQSVEFLQQYLSVGDQAPYSTSDYYLQITLVNQNFISDTEASFQFFFPNNFLYIDNLSNTPFCKMNDDNITCTVTTAAGLMGGSYISQVNFTYSCTSIGGCVAETTFVFQLWQARNRFSSADFTLSNGGTGGSFIVYSFDENANAVDASIISFANSGLTAQLSSSQRATITSLSVNNDTVGASADITIYFTIGTRIAKLSYIEIYIPLDAFTFYNTHTFKCYKIGSVTQVTCSAGTINSTHYGVIYQENCASTDYCPDSQSFSIVIRGFQNRYSVASTTSSVYVLTYTSDMENIIEYNGEAYVPSITREEALIHGITYSFSTYTYVGSSLTFLLQFNILNKLASGDSISLQFSSNIFLGSLSEVCYFQSSAGSKTAASCAIQNDENTSQYESITSITVTVPYSVDFNRQISIYINNLVNFFEVTPIATTISVDASSTDDSKIASGSTVVSSTNILKPMSFNDITCTRVDGNTEYAAAVAINLAFTYPILILEGSIMNVSVPLTQFLQDEEGTISCSFEGSTDVDCSITSSDTNYYYLSISLSTNLCNPGDTCTTSDYSSYMVISGFKNPYQASSNTLSFNISISHDSNQILVNPQTGGISDIFATPALQISYFSGITVYQNETYITGSLTSYLFYFKIPDVIPSDSIAIIEFPEETITKQNSTKLLCTDYDEKITFSCSYTTTDNDFISRVTINNLCTKLNCSYYYLNVTIKIQHIMNVEFVRLPRNETFDIYLATTSGFTLFYGNTSESALQDLSPKNITNFTATRSSTTVGAYKVTVTLSFISPNRMLDGSYIYLTIPFEQVQFQDYTDIECGYGKYGVDYTCEYINSTSDNVTIRMQEYCDGDCYAGTTLTYYLKNTINPSSLASNYPTTTLYINVTTSTNQTIEQYVPGVNVSPNLAGIKISSVLVSRQNNLIGALDYIVLSIPLTSLLDSATYITLSLPSLIALQGNISSSSQTIECEQLISSSWQTRSCSYTYYNSTSSSYSQYGRQSIYNLTMTGICSVASVCYAYQNLNVRFKVRNPFSQYIDSSQSFNLYFMTGKYLYGYAQVSNNLSQLNPNQIVAKINQSSTNNTDDCQKTGAQCQAWININTSNPVPSTNNSGWMVLNVPSQMAIEASTCTGYLFNTIAVTCKINGGYQIQVKHNSLISNSTLSYQYQIYIQQLKNPFSTQISDSFEIITYQLINKVNYQIDSISDGLAYQVSQPNSFQNISVTRSNIQITSSTQLTFTLVNRNQMLANSSLIINIPSTQATLASVSSNQVSCSSAFTTGLSCSLYNSTAFQLQNICKSSSGCKALSTIVFQIDSTFINNPSFVKDPYTDADSIGISSMYTDVNGSVFLMDQTLSGIFITPALTPVNDIAISSIQINGDGGGYNTSQIVNLTVKVSKRQEGETFTHDYLRIKFEGPIFNADPYYTLTVSINGVALDSSSIIIQQATNKSISYIVFECVDTSCKGQSQLTVLVQNIQNPYFIQNQYASNLLFLLVQELYASPDQVYGEDSQDVQSLLMSKLQLSNFTSIQVFQSNGGLSAQEQIQLEFSLFNNPYIPDDSIISLGLPKQYGVNTSALACSHIFNENVHYTCIYSTMSNMILIDNYFDDEGTFNSMTIATVAISIQGITNPSSEQEGSINVMLYDGDAYYGIDQSSFKIKTQKASTNCSDPSCELCSTADGTCYSCKIPSNNPFLVNKTCSISCPSGYYESNMKCYQCAKGCSTCQTYDSCSSCQSPLLFVDGACIAGTCPANTTLNSNNQCTRTNGCENDCQSCGLNNSYCYQCVNPLLSFNGQCESSCPSSYYVSNQTCLICNSLCKECAYNADHCTGCNSANTTNEHILDLSINSCVTECSSSAYPSLNDSNVCEPCSSQCLTCSGSGDSCTSCYFDKETSEDVFFYQGECLQDCPAGLYKNYTDHECSSSSFIWTSLPPLYLISSVGLTTAAVVVSKAIATKAAVVSDVSGLFIVGLTQIEFMNRVMTIGNLWFSTKTLSFCVTGMNVVANSLMGVYFTTLIVGPMASQLQGASSGVAFTLAVGLSQVTGVNSIRLVTSGFMGISSLSNNFGKIPYYKSQLELLSLMSAGLSLFQMGTGVSQFFDFSQGSDVFGFGANSLVLNSALIGLQGYKYIQAAKLFKSYSAVAT